MDTPQTVLENFIDWISRQEDIPFQTRVDMLQHLDEVGHFDEKALSFVDQYMDKKEKEASVLVADLTQELALVQRQIAQEKNPETSKKNQIQTHYKNYTQDRVNTFGVDFRSYESVKNKSEESILDVSDAQSIADLKANLR